MTLEPDKHLFSLLDHKFIQKLKNNPRLTMIVTIILVFGFVLNGSRQIIEHMFPAITTMPLVWGTYSVFLLAAIVWFCLSPTGTETVPLGRLFHPVGSDLVDPFPRPALVDQLIRTFLKSDQKLLIVTGASGTGKTILLSKLISSEEYNRVTLSGFNDNAHFKQQILKSFQEQSLGELLNKDFYTQPHLNMKIRITRPVLLVFDQFEEFLNNSDAHMKEWFSLFLQQLNSLTGFKVVLIVREEYFFKLRFLKQLSAIVDRTIVVEGINFSIQNGVEVVNVTNRLKEVVENDDCFDAIRADFLNRENALPLEVQMVGFMLEDIRNQTPNKVPISRERYIKELGGQKGLIQRYFLRFINSTSDRDAATACLYALSSEKHLRKRYNTEQLRIATHRDEKIISIVLEELYARRLLRKTDSGNYMLAHDYLAEKFCELSGSLLDPLDRDNINYFLDVIGNPKEPQYLNRKFISASRPKPWCTINILFFLLYAMLFIRLVRPCYNWPFWHMTDQWVKGNPFANLSILRNDIDLDYLPAFIICTTTAWYVWHIFKNFIQFIDEQTILSRIVLGFNYTMLIFAMFQPYCWPIFAGLGGLAIGVRLLATHSGQRKQGISQFSTVKHMAVGTMLNMIVLVCVGLVYASSCDVRGGYSEMTLLGIKLSELAVAVIIAILLINVTAKHSSRERGVILLSFLDRLRKE